MAKTKVVDKVIQQDLFEIVKFQIMLHCHLNNIVLNQSELSCLTLLGCVGEMQLITFCRLAVEKELYTTPTAVNNCLARVEKSKLFIKKGGGKKIIFLNPELKIQTKGNILLNLKIVRVEAQETKGVNQGNSVAVEHA